jgi:hypothetical protein
MEEYTSYHPHFNIIDDHLRNKRPGNMDWNAYLVWFCIKNMIDIVFMTIYDAAITHGCTDIPCLIHSYVTTNKYYHEKRYYC